MPKPNTYVQLLQAQKAIKQLQYDNHVIKGFTVQPSPGGQGRRRRSTKIYPQMGSAPA